MLNPNPMMSIALRHPALTLSCVSSHRTPRSLPFLRHIRVQFSRRRFKQMARNVFSLGAED